MLSNIHDSLCISVTVEILVGWDKLVEDTGVVGIMLGETPYRKDGTDGQTQCKY